MSPDRKKFISKIPILDLSDGVEMLSEFMAESLKHLLTAKNSLLILETVPEDKEAIDTIFKAFHTIKGLADFLNLEDIRALTQEAETLLDMTRKNVINFNQNISVTISETIDSLHKLIDLLNEQASNDGELKSEYLDVTPLIATLQEIIDSAAPAKPRYSDGIKHDIPTINIDKQQTDLSKMEEQLKSEGKEALIDKKVLQKLTQELATARDELQRAQGKLAERQRELIKERELAIRLTQQAQSMARAKSEYLASMAHEIRTLINAILGFASLLKQEPLKSKAKEQLDTIILSGNLLLGIVNDILDFSKVEAGKLKLEKIHFNLLKLVEDVFKIIRTRLNGKPINLYFNIDEKVPRDLLGDPTRIKQIFINLLDNAIKFTEDGEIGLTVHLNEGYTRFDKKYTLLFAVEDTGMGIPEDRKDQIFESFTQANTAINRQYGGSGLGLSLVKNYIENMGGKIWIESEVGKGSKFVFTANFEIEKTTGEKSVPPKILKEMTKKQVFIVEGNEKNQQALKAFCQKFKLKLSPTVSNIRAATEQLGAMKKNKEKIPDIIFIDAMLPNKEGFALASKIREDKIFQNTKLIAVSSDVSIGIGEGLRENGFDDHLAKPILEEEFANVLLEIFSQKQPQKEAVAVDEIEKVSCKGLKILVAEDSLPNQELLKVHFESLGCVVDYVDNGQEAVEKLKTNDYDICLMDLQMPVMGGVEATRIIRTELNKKTPIVALTAAEMDEEKQTCLDVGMNDYLAKPFDVLDLKRKVVHAAKI